MNHRELMDASCAFCPRPIKPLQLVVCDHGSRRVTHAVCALTFVRAAREAKGSAA